MSSHAIEIRRGRETRGRWCRASLVDGEYREPAPVMLAGEAYASGAPGVWWCRFETTSAVLMRDLGCADGRIARSGDIAIRTDDDITSARIASISATSRASAQWSRAFVIRADFVRTRGRVSSVVVTVKGTGAPTACLLRLLRRVDHVAI